MIKNQITIFIWIVLLIACNKTEDDNHEIAVDSYLKMNNSIIDTNMFYNQDEFQVLQSNLENHSIFLFGEKHGMVYNEIIDYKLLQYLYYNAGVRYYIEEMGYGNSALINQYIHTGDIGILDTVFNGLTGTQSGNLSLYEKWKKVYEFNSSLPENDKLTVIGLDVEFQIELSLYHLWSLLPSQNPPAQIESIINRLKNYRFITSYEEKYQFGAEISENITMYSEDYINFLGNNYFDFSFTARNIKRTLAMNPENYNHCREEIIYRNFVELYQHFPEGKYYGKWGKEHVLQVFADTKYGTVDDLRFAIYLNADTSVFSNQVLSIASIYIDCEDVDESYKDTRIIDFDNSLIQIFKLNNTGSPFESQLYFINNGISNSTIDYFQYVIKIKGSPASEGFE